jgi:hypothetical protein
MYYFCAMLRTSGILFMALLYLFTASGFAVNLHYCNNRIANVSINAPAEDCSGEIGDACAKPMSMDKGKMDCRNSYLIIKLKDDHQKASVDFHAEQFTVGLPVISVYDQLFTRCPVYIYTSADRSPPDPALTTIPVFLRNCIFRI